MTFIMANICIICICIYIYIMHTSVVPAKSSNNNHILLNVCICQKIVPVFSSEQLGV